MISEELIKAAFRQAYWQRLLEWRACHAKRDKEIQRKAACKYWKKNIIKNRERNREYRKNMANYYVCGLLSRHLKTEVRDYPQDIIDAYRGTLSIKRKVKKLQGVLNER